MYVPYSTSDSGAGPRLKVLGFINVSGLYFNNQKPGYILGALKLLLYFLVSSQLKIRPLRKDYEKIIEAVQRDEQYLDYSCNLCSSGMDYQLSFDLILLRNSGSNIPEVRRLGFGKHFVHNTDQSLKSLQMIFAPSSRTET